MAIVIGIDVGISTTKIVGINDEGQVVAPKRIKATDPVASLYGAFGKYLYDNKISLSDVEQVMITGVGAAYIDSPIYGLPTAKADEFISDGLGASYETDIDRMIVVSMGTGTSLVQCIGDDIRHIGGIGVGGGTLMGLSRIMLQTDDIHTINKLANEGDLKNIDVQIGDISPNPLPGLPKDATASLFGNAKSNATREDIALGIITTVLQTIGSTTILSSLGSGIKEYVLIGNLTLLPQCKTVFPSMEKLFGVRFIIPEYSEFCTAIGAALVYVKGKKSKE
ncbi:MULTISPECIES: type II pantothenate kinase [Prevotella]|uniref:type II pantothenate kinase n=1 Tax=Prevotella TaxID=838 RepID=UPI000B97BD32|nr:MULTISPECIES: type II pantothenate kinase [Prevotella]MCF2635892.1 type II pantothenate kinase [Prevotella dentalis]OYP72436.1 type II pantothenate kinase [Prevotella sp. P4-67]